MAAPNQGDAGAPDLAASASLSICDPEPFVETARKLRAIVKAGTSLPMPVLFSTMRRFEIPVQQALDPAFVAGAPYQAKEPMHISVLFLVMALREAVQHLSRIGWPPDALAPTTADLGPAARALVTNMARKTFPQTCHLLCETLGQPPTDDADLNTNWVIGAVEEPDIISGASGFWSTPYDASDKRPKLLRETILLITAMVQLIPDPRLHVGPIWSNPVCTLPLSTSYLTALAVTLAHPVSILPTKVHPLSALVPWAKWYMSLPDPHAPNARFVLNALARVLVVMPRHSGHPWTPRDAIALGAATTKSATWIHALVADPASAAAAVLDEDRDILAPMLAVAQCAAALGTLTFAPTSPAPPPPILTALLDAISLLASVPHVTASIAHDDHTALRVLRALSLTSALDNPPHAALDRAMAAFATTSIPTIAVNDRSVLTDLAHVPEGLPTARAHAAWFAILLAHWHDPATGLDAVEGDTWSGIDEFAAAVEAAEWDGDGWKMAIARALLVPLAGTRTQVGVTRWVRSVMRMMADATRKGVVMAVAETLREAARARPASVGVMVREAVQGMGGEGSAQAGDPGKWQMVLDVLS
ncbi:hypothetical protein GGF31_008766 [Allomyces arbusculus]|nr:hypothetical protein GGF31_008766 [Allomyces arbusculus]